MVTGQWYYGLDCPACFRRFGVLDNPAASTAPLCFTGAGQFRATCPHCGDDSNFPLDAMVGFRAG